MLLTGVGGGGGGGGGGDGFCFHPWCFLLQAIANESGINFISVKGPELLNMVSTIMSLHRCPYYFTPFKYRN